MIFMKKLTFITLIVFRFCQLNGQATDDDIALIQRLLVVEYVATPNDPASRKEVINNAEVALHREVGTFWTSPGIPEVQKLVREILYTDNHNLLQYFIADVLRIQNKKV